MSNEHARDDDRDVLKTAINALDESIEHLDGHTLSRLNQARHQALAHAEKPRQLTAHWIKAGAVAAVIFTVVNGWMMFSTPDIQHVNMDGFEVIIANEDFELMQDLDFVTWMIEQEHAS